VLRVAQRHGRRADFHRFGGEEVRVGRGLRNDLIVADPYVGAEQFRFRRAGGQILLDVLDATNPVMRNGLRCEGCGVVLAAGDVITVGQSLFEVLLESSSVPAARRVSANVWERLGSWRPALALLTLLVTAAAALLVDYLDTFEAPEWGELLAGPLFLVMVIVGWAAAWAVVGRLLRNQTHFFTQLFASSLVTLLTMEITLAAPYAAYAIGFDAVVYAIDWLLSALLSFGLVYVNLRLATNLHRPATVAGCGVALMLLLVHGLDWLNRDAFNPNPDAETLLRAPFAKLRDGIPMAGYQDRLAELFGELEEG
jgi:hypothetical protein